MDSEIKDIINRLERQGKAIEKAIAALRELDGEPGQTTPTRQRTASQSIVAVGQSAPNKGRKMSEAQKKKISQAMRARYAARKKAA
jgi:hypothetical protein